MSPTSPVRVLFAYHHLPHYRFAVFEELQSRDGVEVHFAAGPSQPGSRIDTIDDGQLRTILPLTNYWFGPFLYQSGLLSLIRTGSYDKVVFLGDWKFLSTWLAAVECRLRGIDTYFWTIGWSRPDKIPQRLLRRAFYSLPQKLLLYGDYGAELARRAGIPADRVHVVGNSSSTKPRDSTQEEVEIATALLSKLRGSRPYILTVVRLNKAKRLDLLIQALSLIDESVRPKVVLVGEGPERDNLLSLAEKLDVHLLLPGAIHSEELLRLLYSNSFASVVPEAAGLTVIQSLTAGVPAVTADDPFVQMPEYEAIEHGVNGYLYRAGDIEDLARAISAARLDYETNASAVSQRCRDSVTGRWTASGQASNILRAIGCGRVGG